METVDEPELDMYLNPSKLGMKEYWDSAYKNELLNFTTATAATTTNPTYHDDNDNSNDTDNSDLDPGDHLQIWFSENNAEQKILHYLLTELSPHLPPANTTTILDIGTGNGHLLFYLREQGHFTGKMLGIDYSQPAIDLAHKLSFEKQQQYKQKKTENEQDWRIGFKLVDIMKEETESWVGSEGFDVVLDKGTFDAISLSEEVLGDGSGRRIAEGYAERVARTVRKGGGFLIITSCNWTEGELRRKLEGVDGLEVFGSIKYPSFQFGGKKGQTLSSMCFRRS